MSNFAYYCVWLVTALVVIAFISASIAKQLRLREVRRFKAVELLDALERYSDWVAMQRSTAFFQGEAHEADRALEEARTIKLGWFPELSDEMVEIFVVHNRLVDFLWTQQLLRLRDPEAWLESDHDTRFMELWRQHRYAVQELLAKLAPFTGEPVQEVPQQVRAWQ